MRLVGPLANTCQYVFFYCSKSFIASMLKYSLKIHSFYPCRDLTWDINDHLMNLKEKLKSWRDVYWRYVFFHAVYLQNYRNTYRTLIAWNFYDTFSITFQHHCGYAAREATGLMQVPHGVASFLLWKQLALSLCVKSLHRRLAW